MLSRSMQNMKALSWAIALLAMLQPFAARCCVCKCDAAEDVQATCLDDCCQGHDHEVASCSSSCSHQHDQSRGGAASQIHDIGLSGYGPCSCPPTCECQLRHAAPTMRTAEVSVRQSNEAADCLVNFGGGTCHHGHPPRLGQPPVPSKLKSSASCCALLCRFVI